LDEFSLESVAILNTGAMLAILLYRWFVIEKYSLIKNKLL
jgi:hypothetical protein